VQQYKNNTLDFNPDIKLMTSLRKNPELIYAPLFLNKDELIKALNIEDRVYGGVDIWASTKMRYRAIDIMQRRKLLSIETLCRLANVSVSGYFD
jgi:hypothetical protein